MTPETKYAQSGAINIAYQVFGEGAVDLVIVPGFVSNVDTSWEEPNFVRFLRGFADFARVILFDKRGTGLSDRVTDTPTLEVRMDDVRAVMDAVDCDKAALLGISEGGSMSALFAATYPQRTLALIMIDTMPRMQWANDWPWGRSQQELEAVADSLRQEWGGPAGLALRAPSMVDDKQFTRWWAKFLRSGASPATAVALLKMNAAIDIRPILPAIQVPTLLLHATGDRLVSVECSRYMARQIPKATLVELDTEDHLPWTQCSDEVIDYIEQFLTGRHEPVRGEQVLATVLFTDIVDSTRLNSELGDVKWRDLLDAHNAAIRRELAVYRGRERNTMGDGFYATFDGPARAIQCAQAIVADMEELNLAVRVGVHIGECIITGDSVEGIAVHIGARVAATAGANQIVVSQTVKDLVAGSGIEFDDHGVHALKGVPDQWHLYAVKFS